MIDKKESKCKYKLELIKNNELLKQKLDKWLFHTLGCGSRPNACRPIVVEPQVYDIWWNMFFVQMEAGLIK